MAETNGKKTVSLMLYVVTVVMMVLVNVVIITSAFSSRPTEDKVKQMIMEQFQEKSYLGQKLLNIEALIKTNTENYEKIIDNLPMVKK